MTRQIRLPLGMGFLARGNGVGNTEMAVKAAISSVASANDRPNVQIRLGFFRPKITAF